MLGVARRPGSRQHVQAEVADGAEDEADERAVQERRPERHVGERHQRPAGRLRQQGDERRHAAPVEVGTEGAQRPCRPPEQAEEGDGAQGRQTVQEINKDKALQGRDERPVAEGPAAAGKLGVAVADEGPQVDQGIEVDQGPPAEAAEGDGYGPIAQPVSVFFLYEKYGGE